MNYTFGAIYEKMTNTLLLITILHMTVGDTPVSLVSQAKMNRELVRNFRRE